MDIKCKDTMASFLPLSFYAQIFLPAKHFWELFVFGVVQYTTLKINKKNNKIK